LLPILGDQYGSVLERAELQVQFHQGLFVLRYGDQRLPLNPRHFPDIFKARLNDLQKELGDSADLRELLSIITELSHLPPTTELDPERIKERQREKEVARERLSKL